MFWKDIRYPATDVPEKEKAFYNANGGPIHQG
jgi:hypothetical protein